jgi:hypothetical protein
MMSGIAPFTAFTPSRSAVVYWLVVIGLAVALGAAFPFLLFLGFWEMVPIVLVATWLQPRVLRSGR